MKAKVTEIVYQTDITSLDEIPNVESLKMNDIGVIKIRTASPIILDDYKRYRFTGGFILIDESTNLTSGAGVIKG